MGLSNQIAIPNAMRVVEIDPQQDPRWESFVASHPRGSAYHHPGWLKALAGEYGQRQLHLACESTEGRMLAVLPMFYTRGLPFNIGKHTSKRRLSSLPRTPLGGPLSVDREATSAVIRTAMERVSQERGIQLQLKTDTADFDGLVDGVVRTAWRCSYVLELPPDPEHLRFGNSQTRHRIKWAVNKAVKLGVRVHAADDEGELRRWYWLYLETMRRNAVPPRPYRFFRVLWDELYPKRMLRLLVAERDEAGCPTMLAGSIFLMFGRRACYAFTGAKREELSLHPNDLIQWTAIHDACRAGFSLYDFGEVPEEHRQLANFKTKWGAEAVPLYRYYYPPRRESDVSQAGSPGIFHRVAAAGWRRLPLTLTARLGDKVFSYL